MAKDLHTLIRLNKWQVDEKRRALGELLQQLYVLENALKALGEELKREQQAAAQSPDEAGFLYGYYADAVIQRREILEEAIRQQEVKVEEAQEELREAMGELKKYELVQEERDREAAKEEERKEQAVLDEIGLRKHGKAG